MPDSPGEHSIATQLRLDGFVAFDLQTSPSPQELGQAIQNYQRVPAALFQLRFGDSVAGIAVSDLWSACCELLLQAELVRQGRLDHFVIDVEQIFELSYSGDLVFCIFSREHVFAVEREPFASSLEQVVDNIFAATTCPRLMKLAAQWGASAIRGLPYAARFSHSELI